MCKSTQGCHWELISLAATKINAKKACFGVSLDHENQFSECYWYFDNTANVTMFYTLSMTPHNISKF